MARRASPSENRSTRWVPLVSVHGGAHGRLSDPMGQKPHRAAAIRLDLPRSPDEEILGVYGEHHPHVAVGVASLHDAHRPVYAVCPHAHPEAGSPFAHLQGDLYHLSLPSRKSTMSVQPPGVAWRDTAARRAHARE